MRKIGIKNTYDAGVKNVLNQGVKMKEKVFLTMAVLLVCLGTIIHAELAPFVNAGFDDQVIGSPGYAGDVQSWNGYGHTTVNPSVWGTTPGPHSSDNAVVLNSDNSYIWQELKDIHGSDILIASDQTYTITVWAARITGQSEVAALLEVGLYNADTLGMVVSETQDLAVLTEGADMVELTYTLATGASPVGQGSPVYLELRNTVVSGSYHLWQARVMVDDVSVTLEVPLPGTPQIFDDLGPVTVAQGGAVTFEVTTNGEEESLKWHFNGSPLADGANMTGSDSNSLTITGVTIGDEGDYTCVASKAGFGDVVSGAAELLTERLFAHWEFDGDLTDTVGGYEATSMDGDPNYTTGHVGSGALAFIDTGAEIIDRTDFEFFKRGYTISCWGKIDETDTPTEDPYYIVSFGNYPLFGNLVIVLDNEQDFPDDPYSNESGGSLDSDMPNTGQWQYMAVTCDAVDGVATIKLYVDGELTDTADGVSAIEPLEYLRFGWYATGHSRETAVDNVKIYTYALDAIEIATEYVTDGPGSSVACAQRPVFDVAPVGAPDCIVDLLDFAEFAKGWLDDGNIYSDE